VYIRFFERTTTLNAANLASSHLAQISVQTLARRLIEGMVAGYRANRSLLRSLILYARTHDDADFKRRAAALNAAALDGIVALFAARASEIHHPNPAAAIRFGLRAVASTLQDNLLFDTPGVDQVDRDALVPEATRLFLRYLGVD